MPYVTQNLVEVLVKDNVNTPKPWKKNFNVDEWEIGWQKTKEALFSG